MRRKASAWVSVGRWHTVALVVNSSSSAKLYVDGIFDHQLTNVDFKLNSTLLFLNSDLANQCLSTQSTAAAIEGRVARIMVWKRAITYSEV
jgi:hypothetical protein